MRQIRRINVRLSEADGPSRGRRRRYATPASDALVRYLRAALRHPAVGVPWCSKLGRTFSASDQA
jgi:hypothetical protein